MVFNTIEQMMIYVQSSIVNAMETVVKDYIIHRLIEHAHTDVYAMYSPRVYVRRETLTDEDYYVGDIKISREIVLEIQNISEKVWEFSRPETMAELVNFGNGGEEPWEQARPWISNVIDEIESTDIVERILKENLDFLT